MIFYKKKKLATCESYLLNSHSVTSVYSSILKLSALTFNFNQKPFKIIVEKKIYANFTLNIAIVL